MSSLTAKQWKAFRLIFTDGLTYEETGEVMGISKAAVAGLIKRIRKKYPDCVPDTKRGKILSYHSSMDTQIKEKF